jgi:hypothetical protein
VKDRSLDEIKEIIELVIREAEVNNDAWRLEYDDLLEKYVKKAFEMTRKPKEEIKKDYRNLFDHSPTN